MGVSGCSQRGLELCLRGTLMGNERLSKGSIMMASRGVMRKQSLLSKAPPSIIYMVIRWSSYTRLLCFICFACFCYSLYLLPLASALWPCEPACEATSRIFSVYFGGFIQNHGPPLLPLLHTPLINFTPVFFFCVNLSTPSLSTSINPPASFSFSRVHFFLSRSSPGNLIQAEHKGE